MSAILSQPNTTRVESIDRFQSEINWRKLRVKIITQFKNERQDSLMNRALIRREARERIMHAVSYTLENMVVDSKHRLRDFISGNNLFAEQYSLFLESIRLESVYLKRGKTEARVSIPLRGQKSLFGILPLPVETEAYIGQDNKPVLSEAYQYQNHLSEYPTSRAPVDYTGLVVDARHLPVQEALAARIYDQDGKLIYGPEYLTRAIFSDRGSAGYAYDLNSYIVRKRAGERPLFTVAMSSEGRFPVNLVLTRMDAAKLFDSPKTIRSLKKSRVVILVRESNVQTHILEK